MPKVNSRNKGRRGEQEVARILRDGLGIDVHRNWEAQAAGGGCDIQIPYHSIEVKNHANPTQGNISKWWDQAVEQAETGERPVLFYKIPRQSWRVVISNTLSQSMDDTGLGYEDTLTMSVSLFLMNARQHIATADFVRCSLERSGGGE